MKFRKTMILTAAVLMVSLAGCSSSIPMQSGNYSAPAAPALDKTKESYNVIDMESVGIPTETEPPTEPLFQPAEVSVVAAGDNLIHTCVYKTASKYAADGIVYDFHYCYQNIANRIAAADLAFVNQETLICDGKLELSGSNLNFNSPVELGYNLVDIGFDVFNMANNHVLDKGTEGIEYTLDYWDKIQEANRNVVVLGTYRNEKDMNNYRITEKEGLKIGWLGYTDHTNGYVLPEDTELIIPYMADEELMRSQVQELAEQTDCVVVSMHWGEEDTHEIEDSVKEISQKLVDWGADVIIGTGPHTLQSMEYLTRADGTQGFVFYSLGNFISGQTDNFNAVGGLGEFHICRDTEGNITIKDAGVTPIITHYDSDMTNVRVYPYDMYTDELVENHYLPYAPSGTHKEWSWGVIDTIIEENVPEEFRRNYTRHAGTVSEDDDDYDDDYDDENDDD